MVDGDHTVAKDSLNSLKLIFNTDVKKFGEVKSDSLLYFTFKFHNEGKKPLLISGVQTSCGCTTAYWPKQPILPQKIDSINVVFNPEGKIGLQNKKVLVFSNSINKIMVLTIQGSILK